MMGISGNKLVVVSLEPEAGFNAQSFTPSPGWASLPPTTPIAALTVVVITAVVGDAGNGGEGLPRCPL
ncbi:hypothetical protein M407DRAFT_245181 [Tulasnella calospora MUT 4182]|uniref:Uncharacterized protein n=1 Tax=Tulasnella calospora MUT 4182 TaxID=1051891 RepID=A0A0C3KM38_9AGAM|nr:hypothetical protein M407DRAFT_245181 [Tulasnella calospora MUT 4182]